MTNNGSRVSFDRGEYDKLRTQVTEAGTELYGSLSGEGGAGGSMLVQLDVAPADAKWEPIVAIRTLCRDSGAALKKELTTLGRKDLPDFDQALARAADNFEETDDLASSHTALPGSSGGGGGTGSGSGSGTGAGGGGGAGGSSGAGAGAAS